VRASAAGRRPALGGFTLLEMLVVMSIVGVIGAMAAMSVSSADRGRTRDEARRLATLLELARTEARATGRSIAWLPLPAGYTFRRMAEDGTWVPFPEASPFRRRTLPGTIYLHAVQVNAQPLGAEDFVVFSPYGASGELRVTVAGDGASLTLRAGMLGRITVSSDPHAGDGASAAQPRIHAG